MDRAIDLSGITALYETWRASRTRLQQSSQKALQEFNDRLVRRLSVETGILERLYDLDRGTTEALITHGFVEDLVSRASTDMEPARLIDILRSQEAAIRLMMDCVAQSRDLTKGVIHELHAILTQHQDTTSAVDQFGNRREIPLLKGRYKEQPNNPRRPDGTIHEYCPPIHVDSEMENLLNWLSQYSSEDPVIAAAWLHHRFTQIHPYQDGNGRAARAITTLVLLRAELLPMVIDRDLRVEYIECLERADAGDLSQLASLFARQERLAILQALSVDAGAEISQHQTVTSAVIDSLAAKFNKRYKAKVSELRGVNQLAARLRAQGRSYIERILEDLGQRVSQVAKPEIFAQEGGPDYQNAHWYKFDVIRSTRESGKFANFTEDHYFVKASFRAGTERLVFVVSFHHVGQELSGIMEATALAKLEAFEDSDDRESVSEDFRLCSLEPFVFTYTTKDAEIRDSFTRWLDASLAVALKEFGDRL